MIRGRFAPSPTGPLHFGSVIAALGSYLHARAQGGEWLVRMEDLDPPREQPGAADDILATLEALGLGWDGTVVYQSTRHGLYRDAIDTLRHRRQVYTCTCSRRDVAEAALPGLEGPRYPGTCRGAGNRGGGAIRVLSHDTPIRFTDRIQGPHAQRIESEVGDFVLQRRDGLFAYQLAVVVDDAEQGITEVVRGSDLLDSTPRQIYLQQLLDVPAPTYFHLPVAVDGAGNKLSKQTGALPVDTRQAGAVLFAALAFLGQAPPAELQGYPVSEIITWAVSHWQLERIPRTRAIPYETGHRRQ
jgi:glutamyl-Q tRNA(Asp) synthetase